MKKVAMLAALSVALCLPLTSAGQTAPPAAAPERARVLSAAKDVMRQARCCTLVTVGTDGQPQARVMDPFPPEEDLTIWLATNAATRKVAQIGRDARVTLCYFDPASKDYVVVLGRAELIRQPGEKAGRWKEEWAAFYRDKNRGDDYVLIRVKPGRVEIVSYTHGLAADPMSWRPVIVELP